MPARLRPTAPFAAEAILVGDPGRALMLAQALLEEPKMSNHARGLWGYTGRAGEGELTIQATGMGGPSAGLVLADLAELGVRRAIRVGTCTGLDPALNEGGLLCVSGAFVGHAPMAPGPGPEAAAPIAPDPHLSAELERQLGGNGTAGTVVSLDTLHGGGAPGPGGGEAADMQTATLFERGRALGVAVAAVLIVTETAAGERLGSEGEEQAAKLAGAAAAGALSPLS
jgi:uridine phosphorylase